MLAAMHAVFCRLLMHGFGRFISAMLGGDGSDSSRAGSIKYNRRQKESDLF